MRSRRSSPSLRRLCALQIVGPALLASSALLSAGAAEAPGVRPAGERGARPDARLPEGTRTLRDVEYVAGGHERQKLDLYLPPSDAKLPLVIWVHGGAWLAGSKDDCPARRLLRQGYAVASVNYRLSQHALFPAQIEDVKAAVRWLRAHAGEHGIDPERFGAWGASAGGHLVALLGTAGDAKDFEKGPAPEVSSRVQAVCDFFGPTDLTRMSAFPSQMDHDSPDAPEARLIGGPVQENREKAARANPIAYVTADDPPFLILHGDKDPLVPLNQSEILRDALAKAGVRVSFRAIAGAGHGFGGPEIDRLVDEFFAACLKSPATAASEAGRTSEAPDAEDWPQWRGQDRDGVARGARLPSAWPETLPVAWRAPAGPGYSTPVLARGRIHFLERSGGEEVVRALDARSGTELWRSPYAAPYEAHAYASKHGTSPKSTTTVAEGRVVAFGITGILSALDASTGRVLWQRDLGAELRSSPLFGVSASPLVDSGLVLLPVGHREGRGAMMAFRVESGDTAWKAFEDGPSYGSPIAAELGGVRQAICFTGKHLVGAAIADGRELWSYPFELPFDETIVTPLVWKGNVVFAGRNEGGTRAIRLRRDGERFAVEELWKADAPVYMSSPVIHDDSCFAVEHVTGRMFCLRLEDGSLAWKDGSFGDYASLVLAGGRILVLASSGKLTVVEATREAYRPLGSWRVSTKPTYAHLVVAGSRLIVRDAESVSMLDLGSAAAPGSPGSPPAGTSS